jgi:hypothetical protein
MESVPYPWVLVPTVGSRGWILLIAGHAPLRVARQAGSTLSAPSTRRLLQRPVTNGQTKNSHLNPTNRAPSTNLLSGAVLGGVSWLILCDAYFLSFLRTFNLLTRMLLLRRFPYTYAVKQCLAGDTRTVQKWPLEMTIRSDGFALFLWRWWRRKQCLTASTPTYLRIRV